MAISESCSPHCRTVWTVLDSRVAFFFLGGGGGGGGRGVYTVVQNYTDIDYDISFLGGAGGRRKRQVYVHCGQYTDADI